MDGHYIPRYSTRKKVEGRSLMLQQLTVLDAKRYGVYTCGGDATLQEAAVRMVEEDVSALVVVDEEGYLIGVLTHTDLLRVAAESRRWQESLVQDCMTREVVTISPDASLASVAQILLDHCIHRVVVVREEESRQRPVAVLASSDIVYHLVRERG
jgi:CBS domain-containing protein